MDGYINSVSQDFNCALIREWSLNYGEGGYKMGGGGGWQVKIYPYKNGGGKRFSYAEEGTISFEVVLTWELGSFSHTEGGGGANSFHPLKRGGGWKSFTLP